MQTEMPHNPCIMRNERSVTVLCVAWVSRDGGEARAHPRAVSPIIRSHWSRTSCGLVSTL
eukprot:2730283-Prymnesium_polylepis.1